MRVSRQLRRFFASTIEVKLPTIETHLLDVELPKTTTTTAEELLSLHKKTLEMRRMEIACDLLYKNKEIAGFCHLYDGQEAVALGIDEAVTHDDPLITAYRSHGIALLRGIPMWTIFAEMLGTEGAATKGKGGSMHFYSKKTNFYGGSGIVGDQVPVGTGLAFALKYNKQANCAIAMYGDGAANQGQLYEAGNMASLWSLPMIYICENNNYAMGTSVERSSAGGTDFHKKVYNVPGLCATGQDVFAVRETMRFAKKYVIENGPLVINFKTYRYHGHSMSDPGLTYRTRDEVMEHRKSSDPINVTKKLIIDNGIMDEAGLKKMDQEVKEYVNAQVERAKAGKKLDTTNLLDDVFVKGTEMYIRAPNYEDSIFVKEKLVN